MYAGPGRPVAGGARATSAQQLGATAATRTVLLRVARACVAAIGGLARGMVPPLEVEDPRRGVVPLVEAVAESEAHLLRTVGAVQRVEAALADMDML